MDDYSEPLDLSLPSVKIKNHQISLDLPLDLSKKRIDNPQTIQSGPFTNSMLKNIPNLTCDKRPRIHQACTSSSLPYINSKPRTAHSCIPVRNQYPDNYEDELESSETPFDFSCRYSETKTSNVAPKGNSYKGKKSKNSNGNYSIYAETDLDQPTDYSLRYAEDDPDSDSDISEDEEKTTPAEFVGDSVKTYCTEGTPYETPFNFSTSTSMSDLRIGDKGTVDGIIQEKTQTKENIPETKKTEKTREETAGRADRQPQTPKMKSEFNSGLTSPEKPMNYCEEGTPGYFSRVSSFGSLNSAAAGSGEEKSSEDKLKCDNREDTTPKGDKIQQKMPGSEAKVVKFENIVNYCEETPLMFSRSSSLGSLDSIEQSMHDGSSVISDFSRLTSGIISPSEIPDSPTQTVPPSPKQRKPSDFGMMTRGPIENRRFLTARRSLPTKSSIFEDDVTKFKEESTPAQFSVATSLSSLTIDDHDETQAQETDRKGGRSKDQNADCKVDKDGGAFRTMDNMQNRCFPIPGSGQFQSGFQESQPGTAAFSSRPMPPPLSAENSTRAYNTEDTPAVLSRVGSASDLSALSMLDEEPAQNRTYLSENSSQSSGDPDGLEKEKRFGGSGCRLEVEDVWVRRDSTNKSELTPRRGVNNLPPYQASTDECCRFAVEDSPAQFSLRSSLSHLTMESEGASGFLDFLVSKETTESSRDVPDSPENVGSSIREENSNEASLAASFEEDRKIEEKTPTDPSPNEDNESVNASTENTKSFELKSDDSRCNSMKKRKWKWKWQFGSEDGQSESGESTQTDKQSTNEEFDQGRRFRHDTNNAGSLDASFKKKKWWKWKFGLKEKDQSGGDQDNVKEPDQNCVIDNEKAQIPKPLEEKESLSKDCDSRNKSKRWKWKWKLNFKDDENGKTEKSSLSFSKLKHQVSPEVVKEPVCVDDVLNSKNVPKEITSLIKFMPEKHSKAGKESDRKSKEIMQGDDEPSNNNLKEEIFVPTRQKLDTPEHSDSEQSVIVEEINEQNSFYFSPESSDRNLEDVVDIPSEKGKKLVNTFTNQSNYASLVEECIQLGMPKKKVPPVQNVPNFRSSSNKSSEPKLKSELNKENYNIPATEDRNILEECIQLGMRKKNKENTGEDIGCAKPSYPTMKNTNRTLNFDSSSLNRLSMGKTRNVFNSNDDILQNIPRRTSEKMTKPLRNEYYGDINTTVDNSKSLCDKSNNSEVGMFDDGNTPEQNILQSQLDNRTIPRAFVAKYNSARGDPLRRSSERNTSRNKEQVSTQNEIPAKSECSSNSGKNPDFAALIEECIQLGMPKRKESSEGALSPNLEHHKMNPAQRWPDYLYKISNENNKSASLPKPSQYSHNTQNFSSNEDFAKPDSQNKRDPVIQSGLENNVNSNRFKTDVSKKNPERRVYMPPELGFNECVPKKYEEAESEGEYKESLYANVDETRTYSGSAYVKEPYYGYKSLSPEPVSKHHVNKGISDADEGTSALLEDCIKLGIPVKKLQDFRRTLERSSSQETSRSVKSESAQRLAESEDEAVYANTTERYYTFRNPATSEFSRSEVKPTGAKSHVVPDVMHSPVLSEKKYSPHVASIKNTKSNEVQKKISTKSDGQDFAAIIEECIQLGMPKRKEFSGETLSSNLSLSSVNSRSNSRCADHPSKASFEYSRSATLPKGATYLSTAQGYYSSNEDFNRTGSQGRKNLIVQNVGNFVQDKREFNAPKKQSERTLRCPSRPSSRLSPEKYSPNCSAVQPDMPKSTTQQTECTKFDKPQEEEEEEPAESLYVNVSKHAAYSRCSNRQNQTLEHANLSNKTASSSNSNKRVEPNYSAIVEECIKLGVPSKKIAEVQNYLRNIVPGLSELSLDEKFDRPNEQTERFSDVGSSFSESGVNNRIPRPTMPSIAKKSMASCQIGESNGGKPMTPSSSSTIEKALEECIQLGWPKSRVPIKDDRTRFSSAPLPDASVKKIDKAMSKNVNVASVVRNMQRQHLACSKVPTATADAEEEPERRNVSTIDVEETSTEKNGFDEGNFDDCLDISENRAESEMSFAGLADIDSKLLNPHIVLASLEKYTAKLMSEAEHRLNFKNEKVSKIHPV